MSAVRPLYFNYQGHSQPPAAAPLAEPGDPLAWSRTDAWRPVDQHWLNVVWINVDDTNVVVDLDVDTRMFPAEVVHTVGELLPLFVRLAADDPGTTLAKARALLPRGSAWPPAPAWWAATGPTRGRTGGAGLLPARAGGPRGHRGGRDRRAGRARRVGHAVRRPRARPGAAARDRRAGAAQAVRAAGRHREPLGRARPAGPGRRGDLGARRRPADPGAGDGAGARTRPGLPRDPRLRADQPGPDVHRGRGRGSWRPPWWRACGGGA
ncbi:hypothetical protein NKH77_54870 [Streptomyces sp. M19]